jgi:hypothetical protein
LSNTSFDSIGWSGAFSFRENNFGFGKSLLQHFGAEIIGSSQLIKSNLLIEGEKRVKTCVLFWQFCYKLTAKFFVSPEEKRL